MPLKMLPYRKLAPLIRHYLCPKDDNADSLILTLHPARERGYLTPSELKRVCRWKSPRAMPLIQCNSRARIRGATSRALRTRSEKRRLAELCELQGVSVPMASAILTLLYPKRYGVIDIRVWQLLHAVGTVTKKPKGVGFNFANWYQFLMIIRHFARVLGVRARDVEWALFLAHKDYQKGGLYSSERVAARGR